MTVMHSGSTKKYSANWEAIFSGKKGAKKPATTAAVRTKKAAPKKKARR